VKWLGAKRPTPPFGNVGTARGGAGRGPALPSGRMRGEHGAMIVPLVRRARARKVAADAAERGHRGDEVVVRGRIARRRRIADQHAEIITIGRGRLGDRRRDVELQRRAAERTVKASATTLSSCSIPSCRPVRRSRTRPGAREGN